MNFEAVHPWNVSVNRLARDESWIHLKEYVVKACSEVSTVDGLMPIRFRVVYVFASGAVQLHRALVGNVGLAHRKERVGVAEDARAFSKIAFLVFLQLEQKRKI